MKGIHSIYTFTNRKQYKKQSYLNMQLIEAYTLILSCAYWNKLHGTIDLYCDNDFYEFIKEYNLTGLWQNIDNTVFDNLPKDIDYSIFWTYPKMYVHSIQKESFTALDADLFMWENMLYYKEPTLDIIYAHPEVDQIGNQYPSFHKDKRYEDIFKNLEIIEDNSYMNTAILYCRDNSFYKELMEITTEFARRVSKEGKEDKYNNWSHTIFCEQRIIKSIINKYNLKTAPQYSKPYYVHVSEDQPEIPFNLNDGGIFHLWGMKKDISLEDKKELEYKLYKWIEIEFPNYLEYAKIFKKHLKN